MAVTGEIMGVGLNFVTRRIDGPPIEKNKYRFDAELGENIAQTKTMADPVIVFFPNGTSQVMETKQAQARGFLFQPEIMNLSMVEDQRTPAGRYKNAIREEDRLLAWYELENAVINRCVAKSGHPLSLDHRYSDESIFFTSNKKELV